MRNRILVSLAAFVAALVLGAALGRAQSPAEPVARPAAQSPADSRPDFSGAWKMNHAKSSVGPGFHPVRSAVFEQKGDGFRELLVVESPRGAQSVEVTYTLDGKARAGKVMGRAAKLSAAWDAGTLVLTWEDAVAGMKVERRLTLAPGGKSAEMLVAEILPDRRNDHKVIFERE